MEKSETVQKNIWHDTLLTDFDRIFYGTIESDDLCQWRIQVEGSNPVMSAILSSNGI